MPLDRTFTIYPLPILQDNYVWLLLNDTHRTAIAVDPGEALPVQQFLQRQQYQLSAVLVTHHHADHYQGVAALKQAYHMPVYGPKHVQTLEITHPVQAGEQLVFPQVTNTLAFAVLAVPGHTLDHVAYYAKGFLFCGDTLFSAGCGRLFEGTAAQLYHSLQKIAALPDDTAIYCTHEYTLNNLAFAQQVEPNNPDIAQHLAQVRLLRQRGLPTLPSTVALEKKINPFLRCQMPQVIESVRSQCSKKPAQEEVIFAALRHWKDKF